MALRLLAPQRGLFATVRSKSKNKSKNLVLLSLLPQHRQFEGEHTPGILKVLLPPRQSRGELPFGLENCNSIHLSYGAKPGICTFLGA